MSIRETTETHILDTEKDRQTESLSVKLLLHLLPSMSQETEKDRQTESLSEKLPTHMLPSMSQETEKDRHTESLSEKLPIHMLPSMSQETEKDKTDRINVGEATNIHVTLCVTRNWVGEYFPLFYKFI